MYILISYKGNSDDYCRGSVMARYDSNFQMSKHKTLEEIKEEISSIDSQELDYGEVGYAHYVISLKDGKIFRYGNEADIFAPLTEIFDNEIQEEIKKLTRQKIEQRKEKEKAKETEKKRKKEELERENRQKQYEELKKEFEISAPQELPEDFVEPEEKGEREIPE